MKVLYAIQGTGNGHISRAREVVPILQEYCHCDILISGTQADITPGFPVKYRMKALSFIFGKSGGIDLWNTTVKADLINLQREIEALPVERYDFVINDFEPVSARACALKNIPCISLSHQAAVVDEKAPIPTKSDYVGQYILKNYAPAKIQFGFHFKAYNRNIYTPVIRSAVRELLPDEAGYYTVYLPSYDEKKLISALSHFDNVKWHVFSKHSRNASQHGHIKIFPVSGNLFSDDMARSNGVLCGAGFETPAEALFLKKKLMVVPMKGQYEQQCNATALAGMGVPVIKSLKKKHFDSIAQWLESDRKVEVSYPDTTRLVIRKVFEAAISQLVFQSQLQHVVLGRPRLEKRFAGYS
mgnify:CR=1 FL=1